MAGLQLWENKCFQITFERVSVGEEEKFHVDGPKTEKAREPSLESLMHWNLEAESIRSGEYWKQMCEVEDSHRDKTEQCSCYIYNRVFILY